MRAPAGHLGDRRRDHRVGVAHDHHTEAVVEVRVLVPIQVPDSRPPASRDVHGMRRHVLERGGHAGGQHPLGLLHILPGPGRLLPQRLLHLGRQPLHPIRIDCCPHTPSLSPPCRKSPIGRSAGSQHTQEGAFRPLQCAAHHPSACCLTHPCPGPLAGQPRRPAGRRPGAAPTFPRLPPGPRDRAPARGATSPRNPACTRSWRGPSWPACASPWSSVPPRGGPGAHRSAV